MSQLIPQRRRRRVLRLANPAPIEPFEQRRELRRRQTHHAVLDLRPTELAVLQPLGEQAHAGSVPKHHLHPVGAFGAKEVNRAVKRIGLHHVAHQRRQPLRAFAEIDRLRRHHHAHRAGRADHFATFNAPMIAVTIAAFASRQIQTLVPSISSSIEWGREVTRSESAACNETRSPSAASTTAGTNGGASVLASNRRRASRRQANNCCGEIPCSRATSETTTPGASEASIARAFSSSDQRRRPPPPLMTSIRRPAAALSSSSPSSLDTSRSPNDGLSLAHPGAELKVWSKQRLRSTSCSLLFKTKRHSLMLPRRYPNQKTTTFG